MLINCVKSSQKRFAVKPLAWFEWFIVVEIPNFARFEPTNRLGSGSTDFC
jgi:hypothetical protein